MSKTLWAGKSKYLFEVGYFHHSWPHGLKRKVIVWSELGYFHHSWQAGIPKWIRQTPNHDFLKSYQTQFGTLNIKIALPWIMCSHEKIAVEWLYNLSNPQWQCFVVGARFFLINFSSLLPEARVAKNVKLLTRIEFVHQIILQGLCSLFTSPSENVDHRHPNCEITLNCEWTEYLEFCFTSSWNHLILIVKQACLCYFDVVVKLLEPSWKWLETK